MSNKIRSTSSPARGRGAASVLRAKDSSPAPLPAPSSISSVSGLFLLCWGRDPGSCAYCASSLPPSQSLLVSSFPGHSAYGTGGANKPRTAKAVRQLTWWLPLPSWPRWRTSRRTGA